MAFDDVAELFFALADRLLHPLSLGQVDNIGDHNPLALILDQLRGNGGPKGRVGQSPELDFHVVDAACRLELFAISLPVVGIDVDRGVGLRAVHRRIPAEDLAARRAFVEHEAAVEIPHADW